MSAEIQTKEQGIKGGKMTIKEKGRVTVFLDGADNFISVDAFTGSGVNYKRRTESLIEIFEEDNCIFSGTFNELCNQL